MSRDKRLKHALKERDEASWVGEKIKRHEPKMVNRFVVEIGEPWNFPSYLINSITRPYVDWNGKVMDQLTIKFYDPIQNSTSAFIWEQLRDTENRNKVVDLNLKLLGPIGDTVEEWSMKGTFTHFDFGKLDYSKPKAVKITGYFTVIECIHEY